jgi:hypothetical protein
MSEAVDRAADELYGVGLDEFVPRRDELARELRTGGDRAAADEVKRLPKPTAPAWAINQLMRARPDEIAHLLRSGEHLRRVQEWLLRREAEPADLRAAVESERAAVGGLVGAAADILTGAGRAPRGDVLERIGETLHAAAADDEVRSELERGRLVRDRAAVGLGTTVPAGATRRAGRARRPAETGEEADAEPAAPERPRRRAAGDAPDAAAARREERAARAAARAEAREQLREAQADARAAERAHTAAERTLARAEQALTGAEDNWARAQDELGAARDELADARREAGAARQAADEAAAEVERRRDDAS